jgi:hypothetical protein
MSVTNTLAYYGTQSITTVKSVIVRVTRLGNFSLIGLLLRFQKWFVVDVLGFQIELCCRYFWPFLDLATFWAIF